MSQQCKQPDPKTSRTVLKHTITQKRLYIVAAGTGNWRVYPQQYKEIEPAVCFINRNRFIKVYGNTTKYSKSISQDRRDLPFGTEVCMLLNGFVFGNTTCSAICRLVTNIDLAFVFHQLLNPTTVGASSPYLITSTDLQTTFVHEYHKPIGCWNQGILHHKSHFTCLDLQQPTALVLFSWFNLWLLDELICAFRTSQYCEADPYNDVKLFWGLWAGDCFQNMDTYVVCNMTI